jgi:hypothetical protein
VRKKRANKPLGPANDRAIEVTQELVAIFYVDCPTSVAPMLYASAFHAGMVDGPCPDDEVGRAVWESGALAAHLIEIGGQR